MDTNPLLKLQEFGQSIWLDYLHRRIINSGELQRLIDEDGVRGVTSNPAIFQKAIGGSHDYDGAIFTLAGRGKNTAEIYRDLIVEDIQRAADIFRPLYDSSEGLHGYVSLEVNPHLAYKTEETVQEAMDYWSRLDRPNVFIKVPATKKGLPAISRLISEGINVNVTLLFGLPRYREVANAYIIGLEERAARGEAVDHIASVASFFLSRIDVLVDSLIDEKGNRNGNDKKALESLQGEVAVACAKKAYQIYMDIFSDERFERLAAAGARPQRLLWASTGTKNPGYSDVKYVEPLIGQDTINTLPRETLEAYRDHGQPTSSLEHGLDRAQKILATLAVVGIEIDDITQQLEEEGVEKFNKPFDKLMQSIADKAEKRRS